MFTSQIGSLIFAAAIVLSGPGVQTHHTQVTVPAGQGETKAALPPVVINDNRKPAGVFENGTLTLRLRAGRGLWRPEGEAGPALTIEAFGEGTSPLMAPAPLIRVPQGTEILASVRNELTSTMRLFGFCERGAAACVPIDIPAGTTKEVRFKTGPAGTYHYWATTTGMPLPFRAVGDTQLSGAFIVDPAGAEPEDDRVFVITDWTNLTLTQLREIAGATDPGIAFLAINPRFTFLMNGLSWPYTERLAARVGEPVKWRVVNLSTQTHTMHLHGFYFDVDSLGDGVRDRQHATGDRPHVVTQLMPAGATMAMTWMPERSGNWLFHCHIRDHVSPGLHLGQSLEPGGAQPDPHAAHDASAGMAGMILGVTVAPPAGTNAALADTAASGSNVRRMTLEMKPESRGVGRSPAYRFVLEGSSPVAPVKDTAVPGPTLVLTRGEPVEITLVNRLPEATAIHWHGMELESYYDGVHGFSGEGQRVTPLIEPGGSFVVRFTPPRTGTFMYHTHMHDPRQLKAGLYGGMLVIEPGETFDESVDHVLLLGRQESDPTVSMVINGANSPQLVWKAGTRHRVRLINISPSDVFAVTLATNDGPLTWQPLTKDGAPVTGRAPRGAAGEAGHRRGRDLRLRGADAAGPREPVARGALSGGQVAGAGTGDREVGRGRSRSPVYTGRNSVLTDLPA